MRIQTLIANHEPVYALCYTVDITRAKAKGCPWSCACAYAEGLVEPHYPVPAIPLVVHWDEGCYFGLVWIDDNRDEYNPMLVYAYDTWLKINRADMCD